MNSPKNGAQTTRCAGAVKSLQGTSPFEYTEFQISAGKVPPNTVIPCTLVIEMSLDCGYPTQTTVARLGW